ncbi:MAG: hypothetical protein KA714_10220 [Limnoraphis sp. WC205]|jgi:hypothetical protein|nr:hypothetical protein [Limnoraphis sp. WC205]
MPLNDGCTPKKIVGWVERSETQQIETSKKIVGWVEHRETQQKVGWVVLCWVS